jgi:hypothetical protein
MRIATGIDRMVNAGGFCSPPVVIAAATPAAAANDDAKLRAIVRRIFRIRIIGSRISSNRRSRISDRRRRGGIGRRPRIWFIHASGDRQRHGAEQETCPEQVRSLA